MSPPHERESRKHRAEKAPTPSFWNPFRHPIYRWLWIATVVANIGGWMYSAAAGWLMTSLSASPLLVSLVQVASSLPMFLFALPAGALADIIDRRRYLVGVEIGTTATATVLAALVWSGIVTPVSLLLLVFLAGTGSA